MVTIKEFEKENLDNTFEWMQNEELKRSFYFTGVVTRSSHMAWFERTMVDGSQKIWAIYCDGVHCGNGGLKNITNSDAEFWMYVGDEQFRGRGVATEAMEQIFDYGFAVLKLNKIYSHVLADNLSVIKVHQKAGMVEESASGNLIKYSKVNS